MKTYKSNFKTLGIAIMVSSGIVFSSCNATRSQKGAAIGASAGAVVGGVVGNQSDNTAVGAIIGAAVGGTTGALIGRHMDKQAEEMRRDLEGVEVERVGEGIKLTFDSGLLFDVNSTALNSNSVENLEDLSQILQKYEDTDILIEGHTDATGTDVYNQELSEDRASSVTAVLVGQGVDMSRIDVIGYGENQPIAANDTSDGREQNRRVEVAIFANKKMKKAAERGDLGDAE